jgi:hypothetical protein
MQEKNDRQSLNRRENEVQDDDEQSMTPVGNYNTDQSIGQLDNEKNKIAGNRGGNKREKGKAKS